MSKIASTTNLKYLAIGIQVFVILLSLTILLSLYIFSIGFIDSNQSFELEEDSKHPSTVTKAISNYNLQKDDQHLQGLPNSLKQIINWIGDSVLNTTREFEINQIKYNRNKNRIDNNSNYYDQEQLISTKFFLASRPLILSCFILYFLSIFGLISIGLERQRLLTILSSFYLIIFIFVLTLFVFIWLENVIPVRNTVKYRDQLNQFNQVDQVSSIETSTKNSSSPTSSSTTTKTKSAVKSIDKSDLREKGENTSNNSNNSNDAKYPKYPNDNDNDDDDDDDHSSTSIIKNFLNQKLLLFLTIVSGLQFYTTTYLICFIYFEKRYDKIHEYCLAKMVPQINDL